MALTLRSLNHWRTCQLEPSILGRQKERAEWTGHHTAAQEAAHYRVNATGFASTVVLPTRKVSVGAKYFNKFSNKSTLSRLEVSHDFSG